MEIYHQIQRTIKFKKNYSNRQKENNRLHDHHSQLIAAKIHFANDFQVFQYQLCHKQYLVEV